MSEPIKDQGGSAVDPTKAATDVNQKIVNQMVKFGMSDKPAEDPKKPPTPDPKPSGGEIEVDGKKMSAEQILAELNTLKTQVNSLSGEDAKLNREATQKLTQALDKLANPAPEEPEEVVPDPEEVEAWKKEMDEKAATDFTGTAMELSRGVTSALLRPVLAELKELKEYVKQERKTKEEVKTSTEQQKVAMANVSSAFKEAGSELDEKVWGEAVNFYRENFGIDLINSAFNNPDGLKKQMKLFINQRKAVSSDPSPKGSGLPAGGGLGGGGSGAPVSDAEKLSLKMKKFGLV